MMTSINIIVDNPITGRIGTGIKRVRPLLSYRSHYFRKNKYGRMVKKAYDKYVISAKGTFYLGLLSRIKSLCEKNGMHVEVQYSNDYRKFVSKIVPDTSASLPHIDEFRGLYPRQKELVRAAIKGKRGYIVSPMGSGKTLLLMSTAKPFYQKKYKGLILVPGLSLLSKTEAELRKFGFDDLCIVGDGNSNLGDEILCLSTFQTFRNLDLEKLAFEFDYVLVDEAHLAMCQMSTYEQILSRLMAPIRIGFTATFPREKERAYNAEGLIGPILGEVTFDEARELEITVEPIVEIICVPASVELKDLKNYREIYEEGIVKHRMRNLLVVKKALELIRQRGKTVLIFSAEKNVEHGQTICEMIRKAGEECEYVYGGTDSETREGWLRELENGDLKCMVSSRVWREGVNIKSLGALILAKGGKGLKEAGEEAILQTVGRALRKADGKSEAVVVDFLDSCRYLAEHSAERIAAYRRMGWQVYID